MPKVFIPPPMRALTGGQAEVVVEGDNIRQLIAALDGKYPGLRERLQAGDSLAPGVGVAIDGVMASRALFTPVGARSEIHFLPAVAGGRS